jgi:mannose-6-phosphate isomerase
MTELYPLLFTPVPKERIWGGESWKLCGLEENNSVVCNGFLEDNEINELVEVYMGDLVGDSVYRKFSDEFPLLIKILDIKDSLSFQVHPSDEIAKQRHNAYGKAEIWYVLNAEPDAKIWLGFNRPMNRDNFQERCANQTLPEVMNEYTPCAGDCFYIPPGTVHAAQGGLVVLEVQETSDITYRVYDWGREFYEETAREMHIDLALDVISWDVFHLPEPEVVVKGVQRLAATPWFVLSKIEINAPVCLSNTLQDSFRLIICVDGEVVVSANESVTLHKGALTLIPAAVSEYTLTPCVPTEGRNYTPYILEVWVPTNPSL